MTSSNPAVVSDGVSVDHTSPAPRDVWLAAAAADPYTVPSQMPQWTDAMCASGRWVDASVAVATGNERVVVMPMVRRPAIAGWSTYASFAEGWGIGGVVAPGGPDSNDVEAALRAVTEMNSLRTTVRPNPELADVWDGAGTDRGFASTANLAHVLDLTDGCEQLWERRVTANGRRGVRRAERLGVTVRCGGVDLVPVFHQLLGLSIERWAHRSGEPQWMARHRWLRRDPVDKFVQLAAHLGDMFRLYVGYVKDRPAAAALVLIGRNAHYTRGAMDVAVAGKTNASDLVQWTAIRDATEASCQSYHMGETGTSASLARFKEKFGARPVAYPRLSVERIPIGAADRRLRSVVKRAVRYRET